MQVGEKSGVVDRKLDLVVHELQRYRVAVAGLECRRASGLVQMCGQLLRALPFSTQENPTRQC